MTMTRSRMVLAALAVSTIGLAACGTAPEGARAPLQPADTAPTSTTTPVTITYQSNGPGPTEWLPLTFSIPSTVTVGDTIAYSGTCGPGWVGEPAGIALITNTPSTTPPWPRFGWTGGSTSVQADSTFAGTVVASVPPGTYYFAPSCAAEAWMDDALYSDGNGGTIIRFYEYPPASLRTVTVVAQAAATTTTTGGSAVTLPPTR